ncbi:MAG: plasmid recombination protein [Lachnospiraceae bacterium]|jgi:hypothetical protein
MASVNFQKIKSTSTVKAILRHCDKEERLRHEHSNKDIDIAETHKNVSYIKLSYEQKCKRYDNRIKYLDSLPCANKRADRVVAFALNVSACENMSYDEAKEFFKDVSKIYLQKFGVENIISLDAHFDEIHQYLDNGTVKESRAHLQSVVIPEINNKLNGKKFSSKKAMMELNQEIDKLAKEKYHKKFLTHEKPRHKTVEELKHLSDDEVIERTKKLEKAQQELTKLKEAKEELSDSIENVIVANEVMMKTLNSVRDFSNRCVKKYPNDKNLWKFADMADKCFRAIEPKEKTTTKTTPTQTKQISYDYDDLER